MNKPNRREFLRGLGMGVGAAALSRGVGLGPRPAAAATPADSPGFAVSPSESVPIDFRYAPRLWQTAYCFPDDPHKSLVGEHGELRYGHAGQMHPIYQFSEIVEFSLSGFEADVVAHQELESPAIPIVHTRIDRPEAFLGLTTFASNAPDEGRVDNVIMEIRPRIQTAIHASPLITLRTKRKPVIRKLGTASAVTLDSETAPVFMVSDSPLFPGEDLALGQQFLLPASVASGDRPARYFFRFPQAGQDFEKLKAGLANPDRLLSDARNYWREWHPFQGEVSMKLPARFGEFLIACARNILQAREVKNGKINFQVGPTVYRGLWVVDGNFILEAARYLGYDAEAQQGLEATWDRQEASGAVLAGAGREHWKDTGIAIFTLVRQAELAQDWAYFRKMQPRVLQAVNFLKGLREKAKSEGSPNGRYGLLAKGFGDGGLGGICAEFTNTLWVLAGLKAAVEAADRLGISGFEETKQFYNELRAATVAAAKQEMRQYPTGFEYLAMLMKEDPQWNADAWHQPRPQSGQWALSHTIYPGVVFAQDDPIVKGHIALMQACTQEDIPAETGWLPHEGVWNYNAAFVAHVYLWAGLADWARRTFVGFLNHASPLYCWREEQPLRGSLNANYIGDMPHNWASAECVLYLRHMLALEDGPALRLLVGIGDFELVAHEPFEIRQSPTRFGRVCLNLEPLDRLAGWRLRLERGTGPQPGRVELPATLGARLAFGDVKGAKYTREGGAILVDPEARSWEAVWKA